MLFSIAKKINQTAATYEYSMAALTENGIMSSISSNDSHCHSFGYDVNVNSCLSTKSYFFHLSLQCDDKSSITKQKLVMETISIIQNSKIVSYDEMVL